MAFPGLQTPEFLLFLPHRSQGSLSSCSVVGAAVKGSPCTFLEQEQGGGSLQSARAEFIPHSQGGLQPPQSQVQLGATSRGAEGSWLQPSSFCIGFESSSSIHD